MNSLTQTTRPAGAARLTRAGAVAVLLALLALLGARAATTADGGVAGIKYVTGLTSQAAVGFKYSESPDVRFVAGIKYREGLSRASL